MVLCNLSTLALPVGMRPVVKDCLQANRVVISRNRPKMKAAPLSVCRRFTRPYLQTIPVRKQSAAVCAVESLVVKASGQTVNRSMKVIIYLDPSLPFFRGPMKSHWTTSKGRVGLSHDLAVLVSKFHTPSRNPLYRRSCYASRTFQQFW